MSGLSGNSGKALALATFAGFLVSIQSVLTKVVGKQINSQAVLCGRSLVGSLACAIWLTSRGIPLWSDIWKGQLFRGCIGFGAASAFFAALVRLPVAEATTLFYLYPIFAAIAAALIAREPVSRLALIGSVVSLAGVGLLCHLPIIVGTAAPTRDMIGLAAGLGAAVLFALDTVLTRQIVLKDGPERSVFYLTMVIAVGSSHALVGSTGWTARNAGIVLLIGILFSLQTYSIASALRLEKTAPVAAVGYLQVVFVTLLGAVYMGEWPDGWTLAGTALVLCGSAPLVIKRAPPPPPKPEATTAS